MKTWIITGALFMALAVILGAFGAHGLKSRVTPEDLVIFETGVRYHSMHALGLILLGIMGLQYQADVIQLPALLLTVGILIFSGSLYILVLTDTRWLGAVTPFGGVAFIAGWVLLAYRLIKL